MSKYEVQHYTFCEGWINTWSTQDNKGNTIPLTFDTEGQAETELANYLMEVNSPENIQELREAYGDDTIESVYDEEDFRIMPVKE